MTQTTPAPKSTLPSTVLVTSSFRNLWVDKRRRDYGVFTTLDNHVLIPVRRIPSAASPIEFTEQRYPTGVAQRTWTLLARQYDPELRRAEL